MELLLGCGSRRMKLLRPPGRPDDWTDLRTLDINQAHRPDTVWDLEELPWPYEDNTFDEVHAYEVLEHIGRQGDYRSFFAHFEEIWRILKPGGFLCGSCPTKQWVWGDPGHTRQISKESFAFLSQREYLEQVDKGVSPMSDYRFCYKADFRWEPRWLNDEGQNFLFVIQAVKEG